MLYSHSAAPPHSLYDFFLVLFFLMLPPFGCSSRDDDAHLWLFHSAEGISLTSLLVDTATITITAAYNFCRGKSQHVTSFPVDWATALCCWFTTIYPHLLFQDFIIRCAQDLSLLMPEILFFSVGFGTQVFADWRPSFLCDLSRILSALYCLGYRFSTYGEMVILWVQNNLLLAAMFKYNKTSATNASIISSLMIIYTWWLMSGGCAMRFLWILQASTVFISAVGSRVPQIVLNIKRGGSGELSIITYLLNVLGCAVRPAASVHPACAFGTVLR